MHIDTSIVPQNLTFTLAQQPAHGQISGSGTSWTYTPAANYHGQDMASVTVTDGDQTATATITITVTPVNDAPTTVNDTVLAAQDTPLEIDPATLVANDTDVDGDTLSLVSVQNGTEGAVALAGGTITFTPRAGFAGTATFMYAASDGTTTSTGQVTVTVAPDGAPVAVADSLSTNEDAAGMVEVLANDTDPDSDPLTVVAQTTPAHGTITRSGSTFTYTPAANYNGGDVFTYRISDGKGATATGTVNVTVAPVNDAPVAVNDTATAVEDGMVVITPVANDSDPDGDTLSVWDHTQPSHGAVAVTGNTFTYTPAANYNGPDSFTYTITDSAGASTATATVAITVTPVNDTPVAVADSVTTAEDTAVMVTPEANDTDVDGDALGLQSVSTPAHGTVSQIGTAVRYTPAANYNGPDSFTYVVSDGHTGTAVGTVSITVTPVNDSPIALGDLANVNEDTTVSIGVLANDSDPDGDTLSIGSFTQPAHGTVTQSGNALVYAGFENFNGLDAFTYTAADGHGDTATATVHVNVNPVDDAPIAIHDTFGAEQDTPADIDVVVNDIDIEGDLLSIIDVGTPDHGTAVIIGNKVHYVPESGYSGTDLFTYTISDGHGGTSSTDVAVDVVQTSVCGDNIVSGHEECDPGPIDFASEGFSVRPFFDCNVDCTFPCFSGTGATTVDEDPETGGCYALYTTPVDQATAASACAAHGGHLATIRGYSEQQAVFALQNGGVWFGASGPDDEDYEWITGEAYYTKGVYYDNWAPGQPDGSGQQCFFMTQTVPDDDNPQEISPGAWDDQTCSVQHDYVCEHDQGLFGKGGSDLGMTGELVVAMQSPDPYDARYMFENYQFCSFQGYMVAFNSDVEMPNNTATVDSFENAVEVRFGPNTTWATVVTELNNFGESFEFQPALASLAHLSNPADASTILNFDNGACNLFLQDGQIDFDSCYQCEGRCNFDNCD